ncbi:MAG TPA: hypothetical protein VGN88_10510, partial [Phycisphaerae bacterium]
NGKKITVHGFDGPISDLGHLRSKIATALPLHDKVITVAGEYRKVVAKMPKGTAVTKADSFLTSLVQSFTTQTQDLRAHIPTDADVAKFKLAFMSAQMKTF